MQEFILFVYIGRDKKLKARKLTEVEIGDEDDYSEVIKEFMSFGFSAEKPPISPNKLSVFGRTGNVYSDKTLFLNEICHVDEVSGNEFHSFLNDLFGRMNSPSMIKEAFDNLKKENEKSLPLNKHPNLN